MRRTTYLLLALAAILVISLVWVTRGASPGQSPAAHASRPTESGVHVGTKVLPTPAPVADPFGPTSGSYVAGREGSVSAAAYDMTTGQTWTFGGSSPQDEASIVKVAIVEALLARSGGQELSASEETLAQNMIEMSDNDAASSLWDMVDGSSGVQAFDSSVGLMQTTPSMCVECPGFPWPGWGLSTTTPEDQLTLLRLLVKPNHVLTSQERLYALNLMENVTTSEAWGVSGGVPSGVTVALKNGWLPLNASDTDWQINSIGWVSGDGRNYLLAVLTTGNPSEQYGIDTIDELSSLVWASLN